MTPAAPDSGIDYYLRSISRERMAEATEQAHQRKITVASFDVVREARPDIQCFSDLMVQYVRDDWDRPSRVVPDNMVVVHPEPISAVGSFSTPLQPVGPLLVLEYVSKHNARKEYEKNLIRYERRLRVPYYLTFYPDNEELTLFRLARRRNSSQPPDEAERFPIPELEMEVGVRGGWARFWFRGRSSPSPANWSATSTHRGSEPERPRRKPERRKGKPERREHSPSLPNGVQLRRKREPTRKGTRGSRRMPKSPACGPNWPGREAKSRGPEPVWAHRELEGSKRPAVSVRCGVSFAVCSPRRETPCRS